MIDKDHCNSLFQIVNAKDRMGRECSAREFQQPDGRNVGKRERMVKDLRSLDYSASIASLAIRHLSGISSIIGSSRVLRLMGTRREMPSFDA
jgi:hypothetical protein